jgi:predicted chitinase
MAAHTTLELLYSPHRVRFLYPQFASGIGKAGKGRGAKGGKGGSNNGKSGKGKAGKASSNPTPKPGPGTPPGTQAPGTPPPTQTPGSPPPSQTPGSPPPTQTPGTSPPTQSPVTVTPPPTQTPGTPPPTQNPGTPPPTSSPTETGICSGLTLEMFNKMAGDQGVYYTYDGFCKAVASWNKNEATVRIFKNDAELAAFFGHVLHESDKFKAAREYSMCGKFITVNGVGYCKPDNYTGGSYTDPYCIKEGFPNKCGCDAVDGVQLEGGEYFIPADKLFFGRGPIQLTSNVNYKDLQDKKFLPQGVDICANPDVIASNEEYAWISAFSFWTTNKGADNENSSHEVVVPEQGEGNFGSALKIINGAVECPGQQPDVVKPKLQQRLDYYCLAATVLEVKPLLKLDGCKGLKEIYNACRQDGGCPKCNDFAEQ